jgi:hypothetical protein
MQEALHAPRNNHFVYNKIYLSLSGMHLGFTYTSHKLGKIRVVRAALASSRLLGRFCEALIDVLERTAVDTYSSTSKPAISTKSGISHFQHDFQHCKPRAFPYCRALYRDVSVEPGKRLYATSPIHLVHLCLAE